MRNFWITLLIIALFSGCTPKQHIIPSSDKKVTTTKPTIDFDRIEEILLEGGDIGDLVEESASGHAPDDIEIIWNTVTYFIPCDFFKFSLLSRFMETNIIFDKNVYYAHPALIDEELDRFKNYTNNFNQNIYDCSKPIVEKGKAETGAGIKVIEERSVTKKMVCKKYTYSFNTDLLKDSPKDFEDGLYIELYKYTTDLVLKDFNEYKSNYNIDKVD